MIEGGIKTTDQGVPEQVLSNPDLPSLNTPSTSPMEHIYLIPEPEVVGEDSNPLNPKP